MENARVYLKYRKSGRSSSFVIFPQFTIITFREREREANPDYSGFYSDYEKAKNSFICSVQQGHVYREQRIVSRVPMTWSDEHFGTTCDGECELCAVPKWFLNSSLSYSILDEIIQLAEGWHVVTVGREPGVFVSEYVCIYYQW